MKIKLITYALILFGHHHLYALPQVEQVQHGDVTFDQNDHQLLINQQSKKAIVDFHSFNIANGESVNVEQLNSNAALLANIHDAGASSIDGQLTSNGQLFLINNHGFIFSESSQVDVGSLVLSTSGLSDDSFLSGQYQFKDQAEYGELLLQGAIHANQHVALIADKIINSGSIITQQGDILAVSQDEVLIQLKDSGIAVSISPEQIQTIDHQDENLVDLAINNTGVLRANGVSQQGGRVFLTAHENLIENSGTIDADNAVEVKSERISQLGKIDTSSNYASAGYIRLLSGGSILLGTESLLLANALSSGNGGEILVIAENMALFRNGSVIESKGGQSFGDGGFVEVSGYEYVDIHGLVDTSAINGESGTFLIDPYDITITNVDANGTYDGAPVLNTYTPNADDATIDVDTLLTNLRSSSVKIQTGLGGGQTGNIRIATAIDLNHSDYNGNTLSFEAAGSIFINQSIYDSDTSSIQNVDLNLTAGGNINMSAGTNIDVGIGQIIMTASGSINLREIKTANTSDNAVMIQASAGVFDANGSDVNINAEFGGLNLVVASGTASLDTDINKLQYSTSSGASAFIDDIGDLDITNINSASGDVTITANGNLDVNTVAVNNGDLILRSLAGDLNIKNNISAGDTIDDGDRKGLIDLGVSAGGNINIGTGGESVSITSTSLLDNEVVSSLGSNDTIRIAIDENSATPRAINLGDGSGSDVSITAIGGDINIDSTKGLVDAGASNIASDARPVVINSDVTIKSYNVITDAEDGTETVNGIETNNGQIEAHTGRTISIRGSYAAVAPPVDPPVEPEPSDPQPEPEPSDPQTDSEPDTDSETEVIDQITEAVKEKQPEQGEIEQPSYQLSSVDFVFSEDLRDCDGEEQSGDCYTKQRTKEFLNSLLIGGQLPSLESMYE